jgi:hypothetical protein
MSDATCRATSGRCTFTATNRPSRSAARWTCPSDDVRERLRLEHAEGFGQAHAELGLQDSLDIGERERFHTILQSSERVDVRRRKQVAARRQQLPKLDERRTELLEIACERGGVVCVAVAVDEMRSMFEEEFGDRRVAAQLRR